MDACQVALRNVDILEVVAKHLSHRDQLNMCLVNNSWKDAADRIIKKKENIIYRITANKDPMPMQVIPKISSRFPYIKIVVTGEQKIAYDVLGNLPSVEKLKLKEVPLK